MPNHLANHVPEPPWYSLSIPPPVNIIISNNTFIEFLDAGGESVVGLIVKLFVSEKRLIVRKFLTSEQLFRHLPPAHRIEGVAFWPKKKCNEHPVFLCDTDFVVEINVETVTGIAFVFFETDNNLRELKGVQHTYCVSSCFYSRSMTLEHCCSFASFPSTSAYGLGVLPSCFPSTILRELLTVKNKAQNAMNTWSKSSKRVVKLTLDNVSPFTWHWMIRNLPAQMIGANLRAVVKRTFMESDELVVQKWRDTQQYVEFTFPEHFKFAQQIFGESFGLGVRTVLSCPLKNS